MHKWNELVSRSRHKTSTKRNKQRAQFQLSLPPPPFHPLNTHTNTHIPQTFTHRLAATKNTTIHMHMYLVPPLILASSSIYPSCNKNKKSWSNNTTTPRLDSSNTTNNSARCNSNRNTISSISSNNRKRRPTNPNPSPPTTNRRLSTSRRSRRRRTLSSKISRVTRTDTIPRGGPIRVCDASDIWPHRTLSDAVRWFPPNRSFRILRPRFTPFSYLSRLQANSLYTQNTTHFPPTSPPPPTHPHSLSVSFFVSLCLSTDVK